MTHHPPSGGHILRRSLQDRVLGGVCAGIADRLGLDPLVVRVVAVAVALVSGGAAVVAYLLAWILVPNGAPRHLDGRPTGIEPSPQADGVRATWSAAGDEVRALATELRRPRPMSRPEPEADQQDASRAAAIDAVITSLGDRLREPEVRYRARRSAAGLSTAVTASVDAVATRVRRDSPPRAEDERPTPTPTDVTDEVPPSWPTS